MCVFEWNVKPDRANTLKVPRMLLLAKDFDYEIAARTWTLWKSWPTSCCCWCCWCWCWCLGPIGLNTQCGCVSSLTRFKTCCDPQRLRFIPYKCCCRCSCCCWCSLHDAIAVWCGLRSALTDRRAGSQRGKGRNGAGVFRYRFRLQMRFESTFLCE